MKAIVPFRGLKSGKKRLRKFVDSEIVEHLLLTMLNQTLNVLFSFSIEPYILTTETGLETIVKNSRIIIDDGTSLNQAIKASLRHFHDETNLLFIMPDLPFLRQEDLKFFLKSNGERKVVPAVDGGITIAQGDPKWIGRIPFGENSFRKLIEGDGNIAVIKRKNLSFDLDTYNDYLQLLTIVKEF